MKALAFCDFKNPSTVYAFVRLALLLKHELYQSWAKMIQGWIV